MKMEALSVQIGEQIVHCTVKRRLFARTLRLRVGRNGKVSISAPRLLSGAHLKDFIQKHLFWLEKHIEKSKTVAKSPLSDLLADETIGKIINKFFKIWAQHYFTLRVQSINRTFYRFNVGKITIRSQKTRFGSCSTKGNLNFNSRVMLAPTLAIDYLIAHELSHLDQMNHSKRFYALVERAIPDYKIQRKVLKQQISL